MSKERTLGNEFRFLPKERKKKNFPIQGVGKFGGTKSRRETTHQVKK